MGDAFWLQLLESTSSDGFFYLFVDIFGNICSMQYYSIANLRLLYLSILQFIQSEYLTKSCALSVTCTARQRCRFFHRN